MPNYARPQFLVEMKIKMLHLRNIIKWTWYLTSNLWNRSVKMAFDIHAIKLGVYGISYNLVLNQNDRACISQYLVIEIRRSFHSWIKQTWRMRLCSFLSRETFVGGFQPRFTCTNPPSFLVSRLTLHCKKMYLSCTCVATQGANTRKSNFREKDNVTPHNVLLSGLHYILLRG